MVDQEQNRLTIDPLKYLNNLPEFYGDTKDLQTFTTLIDRVYPHLRTYDELSQLLFSDIIKSKLKGKARQTIEINCHAISWSEIKTILQNNFGDRRSCDELFDELRGVTFNTNTLEFYNEVNNRLHRLNNKLVVILGETEAARQSASNNMQTALNIFRSKIPEPMKTILFCRNPRDLEEAMDILFQAGYAYIGNDNSQTKQRNDRQHNRNHTQPNRHTNYNTDRQRNFPQPNRHTNFNTDRQRNFPQPYQNQQRNFAPPYQNRQRNPPVPYQNQQGTFPQPYQTQRNFPQPFQTQRNFSQSYQNQQHSTSNAFVRQPQPVEPMDINNHEITAQSDTNENFRQPASGGFHI